MLDWTTACPDWERRIVARESLLPALPINKDRAEKALRIFKRLRMVDVLGKPTMGQACAEWVFDFVRAVFGCFDPETKRQLIREFFLCIAKKNGKSSIAAAVMITALIMNERALGEYLILAPTKDVADNSFIPAYAMVKEDEALHRRYKPSDSTREIVNRLDGSILAVKSADAEVVGGQKAIAVFIDELWLFGKKASAANLLSEATGSLASRPEGFVVYASTQSDDPPTGVFKTKLDYYRQIRDGEVKDRRSLPLIYEYPKDMQVAEAWRDPATWHIPNPSLGRSVDPEWLASKLAEKEQEGLVSLRLFLAKHFNIQAGIGMRSDRWPGAEYWRRAVDPTLTLDTLIERSECIVIGADGGGLDDLFGLSVIGREKVTKRWLSWSRAWAHESVLDRRKSIAAVLADFAKAGEIEIIDDELVDVAEEFGLGVGRLELPKDVAGILRVVVKANEAGLLAALAIDMEGPYGELIDAAALVGVTVESEQIVGIGQGYKLMHAIKGSERKLANGTMVHAPSAMMDWCVANLKIEPTATAIRATKQNAGDAKIDPAMALFDAASVMQTNPEPKGAGSYLEAGPLLVM